MDRFELAGTRAALLTLMISSTALAQVPTQPGVVGRPVAGVAAGPAAPGATARPAPPIRSAAGVLSPYPTKIAVLDVKQVFEQHIQFKNRMVTIDADVKKLQGEMTQMQTWIGTEQKRVQALPNGVDRDQQEAQVAQQIANFKVQEAMKKKSILVSEAKVYFETYENIEKAVVAHCQRQQIQLVVRFDGRPMDANNRASVMSTVNRSVVYQAPQLNITNAVLAMVNAGQQLARPAGPTGPAQAIRPAGPIRRN